MPKSSLALALVVHVRPSWANLARCAAKRASMCDQFGLCCSNSYDIGPGSDQIAQRWSNAGPTWPIAPQIRRNRLAGPQWALDTQILEQIMSSCQVHAQQCRANIIGIRVDIARPAWGDFQYSWGRLPSCNLWVVELPQPYSASCGHEPPPCCVSLKSLRFQNSCAPAPLACHASTARAAVVGLAESQAEAHFRNGRGQDGHEHPPPLAWLPMFMSASRDDPKRTILASPLGPRIRAQACQRP